MLFVVILANFKLKSVSSLNCFLAVYVNTGLL